MSLEFESFLERLKDRFKISDVISSKVKLKKRGGHYLGLCPFHHEKTPSFVVQNSKGTYHCFGCGEHGSVIDWVMNTQGLEFIEAVEKLASSVGLEIPQQREDLKTKQYQKKNLKDVLEKICAFFEANLLSPQGGVPRDYLKFRKLNSETIKKFRLGYALPGKTLEQHLDKLGIAKDLQIKTGAIGFDAERKQYFDYFRNRLIFPIFNRQGEVVAFGGRSLDDEVMPKYLNSPETEIFHKGEMIYGAHIAIKAPLTKQKVICVEGYMDVISLNQAGFLGAVAPLGTALGEMQMEEMWRISPQPVLCFDGDKAGQNAAMKALERALPILDADRRLSFLSLSQGDDPDSLIHSKGTEAFRALLDNALSTFEYLWKCLSEKHSISTPDGMASFAKEFKELLKTIVSPDVKNAYFDAYYKKFSKDLKGVSYSPPGSQKMTLGVPNPLEKMTQTLLGLVLKNPQILSEIESEFISLYCAEDYKMLHQSIIDYYFLSLPLEKSSLVPYLKEQGFEKVMNAFSKQVGFQKTDHQEIQDLEKVSLEWKLLYKRFMDFEEIYKRKSGTEFEDRNYQEEIDEKISALKQHLEKED